MNFIIKIFILTTIVFLFSCKKKEETNAPSSTGSSSGLSISSTEYIKFSLSTSPTGLDTNYIFSPSNCCWPESYGGSGFNFYSIRRYTGAQINGTGFEIWKADTTFENNWPLSSNYFRKFLKIGNTQYSKYANSMNVDDNRGVCIRFTDIHNVYWSSHNIHLNGVPFQPANSTFNITDNLEYTNSSSRFSIKFKAQFNCKLYNSFGDSLYLTNGEIISNLSS